MRNTSLTLTLLLIMVIVCGKATAYTKFHFQRSETEKTIDSIAFAKGAPVKRLSAMASGMQWVGKAVDEPNFYVWCTSPIMSSDRKVHLFCSRWPKKLGMNGWMTHSEIAHYIGDQPEGPFRFVNTAISANPGSPWNNSVLNPAIFKFEETFVLLYVTFDHRDDSPYRGGQTLPCGKMYTCMATSNSINGPWVKKGEDGMIVFPSKDPKHYSFQSWSLDNPTMLQYNGTFYIYFKSGREQFKSRYCYATSNQLEGPYKLGDEPCTDNINYIEDATVFIWKKKICLLTDDNMGSHTGVPGRGILWQSESPVQFRVADASIGFLKILDYYKNLDLTRTRNLYGNELKFERPGILMIDGKPAYFYGPSGVNLEGADHTCSYVMKINDYLSDN